MAALIARVSPGGAGAHGSRGGVYARAPTGLPRRPWGARPHPDGRVGNIYQLLPFTQADLTQAAGVVRQFCTEYATYSYTGEHERLRRPDAAAWSPPELAATLEQDWATPGVAQARTQQRQTPPAAA